MTEERKPGFTELLQQWLLQQSKDYEEAEQFLQQLSGSLAAFHGDRISQTLAQHPEKVDEFVMDYLYQQRLNGDKAAAAKLRERMRLQRVDALLSPKTPSWVYGVAIAGISLFLSTLTWSTTNGTVNTLRAELDDANKQLILYEQSNRELAEANRQLAAELSASRSHRTADRPVLSFNPFGGSN